MKSIVHQGFSRRWLGLGLSLFAAVAAQAQTQVTFMVDMSTETAGTPTAVYVTGTLPGMGWAEFPPAFTLINVSGTIWSNTFTDSNPPGTVESVKFNDNLTGWEPSNNREFLLGTTGTVGPGTEVLPLALWNSASTWPAPTNYVQFQVDMSAQVALGNFTNGDPTYGSITVSGDFEGWNGGLLLTNNPTLSGNASNVYSAICPAVGFTPDTVNYKFRMNSGWESPASTSGNNRQATISTATSSTNPAVLPLVFYNDNSIYDLVLSPITVTFTLYMTNLTMDESGYAFQSRSDTLWINGDFINNWNHTTWPGPISSFPAAQQMIEVGMSDYYTNSFVVPRGNSIYLNYKYSINSEDDENAPQTNHVREVRSYGPTYAMPQDVWSRTVIAAGVGPYPNPGITSTNIVEPDFGYLKIQPKSGGAYPITWLGRPGVVLQNTTNLSGGWQINAGTDASQSTNWPSAGNGNSQFFRLMKEQ